MQKRLINIYHTLRAFISHPFTTWETIDSEQLSIKNCNRAIVFPSILAISISTFAGYLLFAIAVHDFSIAYALTKSIAIITESFFSFYISYLILKELRLKFRVNINGPTLYNILAYSFIPFWTAVFLSGILVNYPTIGAFLKFLGSFGILIFMLALDHYKATEKSQKGIFTVVSLVIVLFIYHSIEWSFGFILKGMLFSNMLNQ